MTPEGRQLVRGVQNPSLSRGCSKPMEDNLVFKLIFS